MIIWLNGPFGAGKTTLANALAARLPGSLLFDPEEVGYLVRILVPPAASGDYQDLALWRRLALTSLLELRKLYPQTIIVPMTLIRLEYLDEIVGGLVQQGVEVMHVFLELDERILRRRIKEQAIAPDPERDRQIRGWRLAQVERCLRARDLMPAETRFLDNGTQSPDALAERVLRWLTGGAPPGAGAALSNVPPTPPDDLMAPEISAKVALDRRPQSHRDARH